MPTLNKLEYLDETKGQIKTALNTKFNSQITDSDTFRSYVSKINNIYTNWPKVTGEDTTLSLTPTKKGKMSLDLKGNTSQASDPTPDSPVDVNVVSGDNEITLCGKNLIGIGTQLYGYVDADTLKLATNNTSARASVGYYFKTTNLPDTITFSNEGGNRANVCYFNDIPANDANCLLRSASNNNPRTVNINKTYPYVHIQFSYYDTNVSNIQIEKGTTASTYEPYQSQVKTISLGDIEYCKIGNYADDFIRNSGNQLWDEEWEIGDIKTADGSDLASTTRIRTKNYIPVLPNTTYYITAPNNINIFEYNENKVKQNNVYGHNFTITTTSTTAYLRMEFTNTYGTTYKNDIMLNKGSTALPYEPYGNGNWYIKKNIGKVVFNGTEEGWSWSDTTRYSITISNIGSRTGICNYYKYLNYAGNISANSPSFDISSNLGSIGFFDNTITSLNNFKTWLSTHNTTVYYPLATPTYTLLNDTLQAQLNDIKDTLLSYQGQTNITQENNDLPFIISASALKKGGN